MEISGLLLANTGKVCVCLDRGKYDLTKPFLVDHVNVILVIDNVIYCRAEFESIKARESCRDSNESRSIILVRSEAKVFQDFQVGRRYDMMSFIDKNQFVELRIEFLDPLS